MSALAWVVVRVLHIAATCTSLGGLVYARAITLPVVRALPSPARETALADAIRRFAYVKWTGVAVVALTGFAQMAHTLPSVPDRARYLACFALKMLGAFGLFAITFLLALPSPALESMRKRRAVWSAINIACGATILAGAALMRSAR
jgi:hypothetical protein